MVIADSIIGVAHHPASSFDSYDQIHIFEDNDTKQKWLIAGLLLNYARDNSKVNDTHVQETLSNRFGHQFIIHDKDDLDGRIERTTTLKETQTLVNKQAEKSDTAPADFLLVKSFDLLRSYIEQYKIKTRESRTEERERER